MTIQFFSQIDAFQYNKKFAFETECPKRNSKIGS